MTPMRGYCLLLIICSSSLGLRLEPAEGGGGSPAGACTSGSFSESPYLTGVQTLSTNTEPLSFRGFVHEEGDAETNTLGQFVFSKAKLAMCMIEKTGCSSWLVLWRRLKEKNMNISTTSDSGYEMVRKTWTEGAANEVFRDPQSVRVLWVRDPLERFLSGFFNKCVDAPQRINCPFAWSGESDISLSKAQAWLRAGGQLQDAHWLPQCRHCELRKRLHEYNVIGLMSHGDFAKNAACVLKLAGLSYLNVQPNGEPFLATPVNHNNRGPRKMSSDEILKKFFTKEFASELLDLYKEDYDLFKLKRPAWVDQATGEWFNLTGSQMGALRKSSRRQDLDSPARGDPAAEDDLASQAEKAGFPVDGA